MLGKIEGWKRRGRQRMSLLDGVTDVMDMSLSTLQELVMPSNHLILCHPLLLPLSRVFSNSIVQKQQFFMAGAMAAGMNRRTRPNSA